MLPLFIYTSLREVPARVPPRRTLRRRQVVGRATAIAMRGWLGNDPGLSALRIFAALAWIASIAPYLCDTIVHTRSRHQTDCRPARSPIGHHNRPLRASGPSGVSRSRAAVAEVKRLWHPCSIWSAATSPTVAGWVTNSTTQAACLPLSLVSAREARQDGP